MSLKTALYSCMAAGVVLLAVAILIVLPNFAEVTTRRALEQEARTRTASLGLELARRLHADWEELAALSDRIANLDTEEIRAYLEGAAGGTNVSWAGYAGTDGIVRVATDGLLEGESVEARPWFGAGLRGGYAGDVHEAVLLQALLAPNATEPMRFIDLAVPVEGPAGRVLGVLGLHVSADWLQTYLAEAAAIRDLDFVLVSADGTIAASTIPLSDAELSVSTIRAAGAGVATTIEEEWPDGVTYMSAILPDIAYEDLPSFGWRLIGRMDSDAYDFARQPILYHGVALGLAAAAIFAIACVIFVSVFLRPITRLIGMAERISRGEDVYPDETRSSSEGARLAAALARMTGAGPNG
ncbi:hypothetical protein HKCCE3408_14415 [Rhodobacterales bacterium HKCCE3408]|nr:hypothetical protein [Rhodobacterales bacterium HKCCE3408]